MVTHLDPDAARLARWADMPSVVTCPEDRRALLRGAAALEELARIVARSRETLPPPPTVRR